MKPVIRIEKVQRSYGDYKALQGVSFELAPQEFVAIMGPSGCGKSTLLNILGLLDRPTTGHYWLDDEDTATFPDNRRTLLRRKKIGFVFQAFNLLPRLSASENVCLPMAYAGMGSAERRERAAKLLKRVGLGSKLSRTPLELSGGERQRVGIARALANEPKILLADEPTGNLDSKSSAEILELFQELHREGMTLILVTHDRGIAKLAQRTFRMMDGRFTKDGQESPRERS